MNLQDAFKLDGNTLNLSGLVNLDQVDLNLSGLPPTGLGDMLSGLDVKVKPGGMQKMAVSLMEGYQAYAKTHPEADYSHLGDNFFEYLKTDGAKQIMKKQMPYTVVIGVDMPTKVRFVFGRCEKNSASGIRIRQAEVIPWIITGMMMPRPLKYPMLLNSTQVRIHSGAKPRR